MQTWRFWHNSKCVLSIVVNIIFFLFVYVYWYPICKQYLSHLCLKLYLKIVNINIYIHSFRVLIPWSIYNLSMVEGILIYPFLINILTVPNLLRQMCNTTINDFSDALGPMFENPKLLQTLQELINQKGPKYSKNRVSAGLVRWLLNQYFNRLYPRKCYDCSRRFHSKLNWNIIIVRVKNYKKDRIKSK